MKQSTVPSLPEKSVHPPSRSQELRQAITLSNLRRRPLEVCNERNLFLILWHLRRHRLTESSPLRTSFSRVLGFERYIRINSQHTRNLGSYQASGIFALMPVTFVPLLQCESGTIFERPSWSIATIHQSSS